MTRLLLFGHNFRNSNKNFHGEQAHTVLVVAGKMPEHWNHLFYNNRRGHRFYKLCEVGGRLPSNHWGIIVHKRSKLLPQAFLNWWGSSCVWHIVESGRGNL